MFVDEFYKKSYFNKLATAIIKFSDEKPEDILCSCCGGILVLYHNGYARKRHKKESTSEFKDFEVLSIYDREPTIQDQLTYINVMCEIFKDKNYFEKAYEYWSKKDINILENYKKTEKTTIMEKQNKFFISDNRQFIERTVEKLKQNNIFIINTLEYLIIQGGNVLKLDKDYYDTIVNRNLPTVANKNNCHGKLRFLILMLKSQNNRNIFMNSALVNCVMRPLLAGYIKDERAAWDNYSNYANSTDEIARKSPFRGALFVYRQSDRTVPIGLDFSTIIDTIVGSDDNGMYHLINDVCPNTKKELLEATQMQIEALKNSERFKKNFYYLEIAEDDDEDDN